MLRASVACEALPLALIVAGGLAACAVNPVSGRREVTLVSSARGRELGAEQAKQVVAAMGLVDDPGLVAYVGEVGARVAAHSPLKGVDYTFAVVDAPEPNAFALPGGFVYVSRGLLALMNSEDELAGVLGQEIGQVAARHAVQRVSRAAPIGILAGLGAMATGMVSPLLGDVVGGAGAAANALVLAPYGRDQEREADRVGVELAAQAGWDPSALAGSLQTLEREDALSAKDANRGTSFFATHPPLPERVEDVKRRAREVERRRAAPIAATPAAFLERLDGLVVGNGAGDGVFQDHTFVHPKLGVALTFPKDWTTQLERDAVGAAAPDGRATIVMQVAGTGDDPGVALAALDRQAGTNVSSRAERLVIGGRPAVHVVGQATSGGEPVAVDVTWVAEGGRIFRIVGAAEPSSFAGHAGTFRMAAGSFRAPTAAELARIRETRLRIVRARAGETVAGLVDRTHSAWQAELTAVANGIARDARLAAEQPVKVAVSEPYATGQAGAR